MSKVELTRLETRLTQLIQEVAARMELCEARQATLVDRLSVVEERMRAVMAKEELQSASVLQNPAFEDEESDGSV